MNKNILKILNKHIWFIFICLIVFLSMGLMWLLGQIPK